MIREQEIILRNSETDLCTFTYAFSMLRSWRSFGRLTPGDRLKYSRKSTQILLLVSLVHWSTFMFLAAWLPLALTRGQPNSPVLIKSRSCQAWSAQEHQMGNSWSVESNPINLLDYATRYHHSCYVEETMLACDFLETPRFSWHETRRNRNECPFPDNVCLEGVQPLSMDTGHQSLRTFGLNRPDADDLTLRRYATCAPMNASHFQTTPPRAINGFRYYNFSLDPQMTTGASLGFGPLNIRIGRSLTHNDYTVVTVSQSRIGYPGARTEGSPVKAFNRSDADLTAIIINKEDVAYPEEVDDPVYGAHREMHRWNERNVNSKEHMPRARKLPSWFAADDPVSMIGCADQIEVCHVPSATCTGLTTLSDNMGWWFDLWQNAGLKAGQWPRGISPDLDTFLHTAVDHCGIAHIASRRGPDLLSVKKYGHGLSLPASIPKNQWEDEVRSLLGTSIAKSQISVMIAALGSPSKRKREIYAHGNYTWEPYKQGFYHRDMFCNQIRFRSSNHTTFSMFGICCSAGIAAFVWLTSSMDGLWTRRLFRRRLHRILAWELDSVMQLTRQLHQRLQMGNWQSTAVDCVPLAFGTLGVPTLSRGNGNQYEPMFRYPNQNIEDEVQQIVASMSRM